MKISWVLGRALWMGDLALQRGFRLISIYSVWQFCVVNRYPKPPTKYCMVVLNGIHINVFSGNSKI